MKRIYYFLILLFFIIPPTLAVDEATGIIRGKIIDAQTKEAIEFANVSISSATNGQIIKGTITDPSGIFVISNIAEGNYTLSISFIGYSTLTRPIAITSKNKTLRLKPIALSEDSKVMNEVEVVAQKSQMKFEIDKKVFNVDQNIASTGGSASDVLTNIPSVEVDNEGEVSLRGSSSVTVWINGKASGLSADNRGEILEQMPAESIEKIEVITNPSAKFSPEGTAGIINIILKEDRKAGYYGSAQAGYDTQGGGNTSGNINYSSGKLDAYANIGYRKRKSEGGGYSYRNNTTNNTFLNQNTESDNDGGNLFTRMGATWHVTRKDHLSLNGMGMFGDRNGNSTIRYTSGTLNSNVLNFKRLRTTKSDNDMNMMNFDFGYKHDFSEGSNIDFTISHNRFKMDNTGIYDQITDYTDDAKESESIYQQQQSNAHHKNWEIQLDYVNQLNKNTKIEAGYKGTLSRENSPVETYAGTTASDMTLDELLYNHFYYNQDIHALYFTYGGRWNQLGYQAGLRGEYSKINTRSLAFGEIKNNVTPYKDDYFSLFPSVFLSYALPNNNELQINYTRRISRPWGGQLNPFRNITDATNISFGNPELTPQYSNAFELNYLKNWENHMLSFSGYYRTTDDVIERISYLQEDVMYSTSENVAKSQSAGVEVVVKNKLFNNVLDLTTTVNCFYYKLDGFSYKMEGVTAPITGEEDKDFSWNAKMIANVMLPYSVSLQLTGNYNAKKVVAQGYRKANYTLDAGLRKSFFNRKLSLSINARDLLDSRKWHTITSGTGFEQDAKSWRGGRKIGFTLTYSFGNMRAKPFKSKKRDNGGNDNMMFQDEMDD